MVENVMSKPDAIRLIQHLDRYGADFCVGGGWGVDALLGEQTRPHADLDLWLPANHMDRLVRALTEIGVDRVSYWPDNRPWNFPLHDGGRLRVDLHLYEAPGNGLLHYGSVIDGATFPAEALAGEGSIGGVPVRCEAPEWSVHWHTGYAPRDVDHHDVPLLCDRFGIDVPDGFAARVERQTRA